jgi:TolB-like protein
MAGNLAQKSQRQAAKNVCGHDFASWRRLDSGAALARIVAVNRRGVLVLGSLAVARGAVGAPAAAKPTLAILLFEYQGKDAGLEPLREGLAQMLISDFSAVPEVRVVERARLKALLAEQKLGQSGQVDPATAARVGKLLGARFLVLGGYFDLKAMLRVDARLVEVETGRIVRSVGASGSTDDFWKLEQELVQKLGEVLKSALPAFTTTTPPARSPVKAKTIATYGRALAALDAGKKTDAKALLDQVLTDAPQFSLAKSDLDALLR